MKKFLVAIIALFCSVSSFGQYSSGGFDLDKENVYYGVRFGGTLASISGDVSVGTKVGLTLGGVVGLRLSTSSPVFLESGLYYTQRGAKDGDYEVTHNNLEIPLVVKYGFKATDEIVLLPFIGPYFAYAVSADQKVKNISLEEKALTAFIATTWVSNWVAVLSTTSCILSLVISSVLPISGIPTTLPATTMLCS